MRGLDPDLAARLREVGVDPTAPFHAQDAWARLRERFGRRATLVDRLALEALSRGVEVEALDPALRDRWTADVIRESFPGFEWTEGSGRPSLDPIEVVSYDPRWPGRYGAIRDALVRAMGSRALRIEHVGSTAVPGLAAKPVIDVQVSVADLADEAGYVSAVESIDVRLRSRDDFHRYFRPPDGRRRTVQVHVCAAGGTWERDHLLFRDYLRAHPEVADAYGHHKAELAALWRRDRIAYTEAKTEFILDALDAAEVWAASTQWGLARA